MIQKMLFVFGFAALSVFAPVDDAEARNCCRPSSRLKYMTPLNLFVVVGGTFAVLAGAYAYGRSVTGNSGVDLASDLRRRLSEMQNGGRSSSPPPDRTGQENEPDKRR